MPNFLRRPLKSSRNNRNGLGRSDRYDRPRSDDRSRSADPAAASPRIGPMLDDRRIDPAIQSDPSRIGPMDDGGRASVAGPGRERGYARPQQGERPAEVDRREPATYIIRRRPEGGSDRDR